MKLIKKQDRNGNEYYEEILETNEEMHRSIKNSRKKNKKKKTVKITIFLISLIIVIISGLVLFNKIDLPFLKQYESIISLITLFAGIGGIEEAARR